MTFLFRLILLRTEVPLRKTRSKRRKSSCVSFPRQFLPTIPALRSTLSAGSPGVFSARYAGENASDEDNMNKLLDELGNTPTDQRGARFVCVMCLVTPDGKHYTARGETKGRILNAPQGENGFGYDPLFYNEEYAKTFAQLSSDEKNELSHRGRALRQMHELLKQVL